MRIRVLTGYNDAYLPIASLTVPTLRDFAARHGHDFHAASDMDAGSLHTIWAKVPLIQRALDDGPEFVFWIDSDALMLRPDRDIRDSMTDHADIQLTWHSPETGRLDWHEFYPHYNSGVMMIRNTAWSRDFFARTWDLRFSTYHSWHDQAAMLELLGYRNCIGLGEDLEHVPDRAHIAHLDCEWNSIPGGVMADDPIIHHYAGVANEDRARLIASDLMSLPDRQDSAAFRKAYSRQMSLWTADVRRRINMSDEMVRQANEVERLQGAINELRGAPRALLKMMPRAVYRRVSRAFSG